MENHKHNGTIALWKFIFCLMIIALHVGALEAFKYNDIRFSGGSIGVEFFFIVAGFLLGKKALMIETYDDLGIETKKFMTKRLKSLISMTLIVFFFSYLYFTSITTYATHDKVNFIWDILLLRNAGLQYRTLIYVGWYTSVLAIVSFVLYPLILKYKTKFLYIIGPLLVIFIGSFIAYKWGTIAWDGEYYTKCLLRGLFEMSLGACLVPVAHKLKNIKFTAIGKFLLTMIETIGFISVLFIVNTENSHIKYDFILILILAICIAIAFSEQSFTFKLNSNRFTYFLEKLSFPMYLSQGLIISFTTQFFRWGGGSYYEVLIAVIIVDVIFSLLCLFILKIAKKISKNLKKIFIYEELNNEK